MPSPLSQRTLDAVAGSPEPADGAKDRGDRRFLRAGAAALCAVGALVMLLSAWLASAQASVPVAPRRGLVSEAWVLQPLVSGNLAICLLWVWLNLAARRRYPQADEIRDHHGMIAFVAVTLSTFFCLAMAGTHGNESAVPIALILGLPTLVVEVPLLGLAVRGMESLRMGAWVLAGFVAASILAQQAVMAGPLAGDEILFFSANSCLIGLAVAVWLVSWAVEPRRRRIA